MASASLPPAPLGYQEGPCCWHNAVSALRLGAAARDVTLATLPFIPHYHQEQTCSLHAHDARARPGLLRVFTPSRRWSRLPWLGLGMTKGGAGGLPDRQDCDKTQHGREDYVEGGRCLIPGYGD